MTSISFLFCWRQYRLFDQSELRFQPAHISQSSLRNRKEDCEVIIINDNGRDYRPAFVSLSKIAIAQTLNNQ